MQAAQPVSFQDNHTPRFYLAKEMANYYCCSGV